MPDVTRILAQIESGDPQAADQLLPLVYNELRRLAAARLASENPGQTLSATALVHEAYLRLVAPRCDKSSGGATEQLPAFDSCGHFFAAAAEAMRRILIEAARRRRQQKRGAGLDRIELRDAELPVSFPLEELMFVDEALGELEKSDPQTAQLVKLHCFGGLSIEQAASALGLSVRTAYRDWAYARAWLFRRLSSADADDGP